MRAAFEEESQRTGRPRLILAAAVAAGIETIDRGYEVPLIAPLVNFLTLLPHYLKLVLNMIYRK